MDITFIIGLIVFALLSALIIIIVKKVLKIAVSVLLILLVFVLVFSFLTYDNNIETLTIANISSFDVNIFEESNSTSFINKITSKVKSNINKLKEKFK